jgi:uncharacterized protein YaiE (UPF0345 family)
MIKVNEYFDGNVKSMGLENEDGKATVGVMAAGEFEFGTSPVEYMTVVSGSMTVLPAKPSGRLMLRSRLSWYRRGRSSN